MKLSKHVATTILATEMAVDELKNIQSDIAFDYRFAPKIKQTRLEKQDIEAFDAEIKKIYAALANIRNLFETE